MQANPPPGGGPIHWVWTLTVTDDISRYSTSRLFDKLGKRAEMLALRASWARRSRARTAWLRRLFGNIAAAMAGVPDVIVQRQLGHFDKVHPDYGNGVRQALAVKQAAE